MTEPLGNQDWQPDSPQGQVSDQPAEEPNGSGTAPAGSQPSEKAVVEEELLESGGTEPIEDAAAAVEQEQELAQRQQEEQEEPSTAKAAASVSEPESEEETANGEMNWYILKVQSNRENSIAEALQRRVAIAGLEEYFGEIIVPSEMVTEFKGGKKRVVKRKLYPGYIVAQMIINDDTWFLVRETPGIGDFTGAGGKPTPMLPHEVQRIVAKKDEKTDEAPKLKIPYRPGDRVKINEGTFENFEGEVSSIDAASGRVTVMINIFSRSTPVELEYWQVEML